MSLRDAIKRRIPVQIHRNIAVLMTGTVGAQLIVLAFSPLLTRLYSPAEFGILSIYSSILATIVVVSSLRYDLAIVMPASNAKARKLALLCLSSVAIAAIVVAGVLLAVRGHLREWLDVEDARALIVWLPLGIVLAGTYQVFMQLATRAKGFKEVARTQVQQAGMMTGVQVLMGVSGFGATGLLVGQILGQSAGATRLYRKFGLGIPIKMPLREYLALARRYQRFPKYTSVAALLNTAGHYLPPFMLALLFSPATAGLYLLAQRVGSQPLTLVGRTVGQAFLADAAVAARSNQIGNLVTKVGADLVRIGTVPIIVAGFIAPSLFELVFGAEWRIAGEYMQWLVPWMVVQFAFSPLATTLSVMEAQDKTLWLQAALFVSRVAALMFGFAIHDEMVAVASYGVASFLVMLIFGLFVLRVSRGSVSAMSKVIVLEVGKGLVLGGFALACGHFLVMRHGKELSLLVAGGLVLIYAMIAVRRVTQGAR